MGEDNLRPSQINSFVLDKVLHTGISDKKRKLEGEQLDLPLSKHKCCHDHLSSDPLIAFDGNREAEKPFVKVVQEHQEMHVAEGGLSDADSARGSNCFVGDSDTAISAYNEANFGTGVVKTWLVADRPSTSSASWGCDTATDSPCSSETATASQCAGKEKLLIVAGDYNPHMTYEEDTMLEFPPHLDYNCSEYGKDGIELYPEKDTNGLLYSNEVNPNIYVLSSGRWTIDQGANPGARKPTIDQEFEQYFSMLML